MKFYAQIEFEADNYEDAEISLEMGGMLENVSVLQLTQRESESPCDTDEAQGERP